MSGGGVSDGQATLDLTVPPRLFSATPSRLASWLDCPRRYRFTYIDRPSPPKGAPWAHNSLGAAVHGALAAWWTLPVESRKPEAGRRLVHEKWEPLGFRDDEHAGAWRERAADMVERYVATLDPHDEPVGVERTVGMKTARLALSGRIDRLDRRGDELVIVDYKTGRHVLTTDDARGSLALAIYAAAAARTMRLPCRRVELHHLPTGDVVVWEHTEDSLARQLGRAEDIGLELAGVHAASDAAKDDATAHDELFPPRTGPQCGWCDFVAHCAAGRQAAPQQVRPWAGLAEEITPTVDDLSIGL
ncbi:MAG TPA: PD-(D/E)XK nuclease family protein [Mycobacteriales bacterium]|nr:PD-(D/E)XK nuclease family protein [Mycobacteriales bacterium]